jgi:hypothetical protein
MTLPLTPEMLEAAYDFLCATPPFDGWNLPHGEDVKFIVNRKLKKKLAEYQWLGDRHSISICAYGVGYTGTLMCNLAHEMIHLYLEKMGWESRSGDADVHNTAFRRCAEMVCKVHGFDPKAFY